MMNTGPGVTPRSSGPTCRGLCGGMCAAAQSVIAGRNQALSLFRLLDSLFEDLVHQAELLRTLGGEELVTLQCLLDLLYALAGMFDVDFIQALANVQDFLGVDHDVAGLALEAARRLVDHHAGV